MIESDEQILADIDSTLDQLIRNAEVIHIVPIENITEIEIAALQKTQTSLVAHLFHMNALLNKEKKQKLLHKKSAAQLEEKMTQFSRLNAKLINNVTSKFSIKSKRALRKANSTLS